MAKKTSLSYNDIINSIRKKEFKPVYILSGEEDYYLDKITEAIEEHALEEDEKDFNQYVYYGADTEINTVIGSAQQYPVMAERQVVILKEAQSMYHSKSQLDKLASYVKHPNLSTILVIVNKNGVIAATSELIKATKGTETVVFRSEKLKDWNLAAPVRDYCDEKKVKIEDRAVDMLCQYIGSPLSKLFGEIDKLLVGGLRKEGIITPDDVEDKIGISKEFNVFELTEALSRKDYSRCMMLVDYFSKNPKQNPGIMITGVLFNYFSKLFLATLLKDKSDFALMAELDMKSSYSLKDYREGLRNYNAKKVFEIIHLIRAHDAKSKGFESYQDEFELLKELVFKIFAT